MPVLVSYSIRNLTRRRWRTLMTIAGVVLVIFASVLMMSLAQGLYARLTITGEPENLLVISRKGQNIMFSSIDEEELVQLWSLPGVAESEDGTPLVSPELMHMAMVEAETEDGFSRDSISVRGVQGVALDVHRSVKLVEGNLPEEDFEILAGCSAHIKLGCPPEALAPGKTVSFESIEWTIAGTFETGGSLLDSELWAQEQNLMDVLRRRTHSFVSVRFETPGAAQEALGAFETTGAIEKSFKAWPERDYYHEFIKSLAWIFWLSLFMVGAVALAGILIGLNTMYTAIINRMNEIATMRVLGFSRGSILTGFVIESLAICLIGGAIGASAGFAVNGLPMKLSYGAFYLVVDAQVVGAGMALAAVIGIVGALLPALRGLRLTIMETIRHE